MRITILGGDGFIDWPTAIHLSEPTGVDISYLPNPRNEADENELAVNNDQFMAPYLAPQRSTAA